MNTNSTNNAAATIEEQNAEARKNALKAAKTATINLYMHDRKGFLKNTLFDDHERAYMQIVTYRVKAIDENGNIAETDAFTPLRVRLYDFIEDKSSRDSLADRKRKIALLASESYRSPENIAAAVPMIANIFTLCGLNEYGAKIGTDDAQDVLAHVRKCTDAGNATAVENAVLSEVHALLLRMVCGRKQINAYKAKAAAKAITAAAVALAKAENTAAQMKAVAEAAAAVARDAIENAGKPNADADAVQNAAKADKSAKAAAAKAAKAAAAVDEKRAALESAKAAAKNNK